MSAPKLQHRSPVGTSSTEEILMIRRCAKCDKLFAPLTVGCSSCASDSLERVPSSGVGSIVSWRVVDRAGADGALTSSTVAIVELDEGPWVYTSLEGEVPLLSDRPVRVHFQPRPRDDRFPVFVVCADRRHRQCRGESVASAGSGGRDHAPR
ncbi:Zn-ribbon domain-containing OB-fold protein [Nocardia africana]|uniref:Predicted nucleic-acid-binding protein containing a Zn-ribbon n=2 Tax=Nocardia africana TaxID=134964 RepID=A0A378WQ69_9NOCA|nr:Predicted nucleic-acid-binding protein containing a Zn-ribbon [Nocardia africana]